MKITLAEAVEYLNNGKAIASVTDTVFGLLAKFDHPTAIENIYTLKGRPENKPLILLVPTVEEVTSFVSHIPPIGKKMMNHFWPGPLTIIFPANLSSVPSSIRAGGPTIAIRVPSHPLLSPLLALTGPLVAPSLNKSGEHVLETLEEIEACFGVELPVFYAPSKKNPPSTLIELQNEGFLVRREGSVKIFF